MLEKDSLKGETIYVIGGGPSLKKENLSLLDNKIIIATNNAYKIFPNAYISHHADSEWWGWHQHEFFQIFNGEYATGAGHQGYPPRIIKLKQKSDRGLAENFPFIQGNNAGHQGLNIAYMLGATRIVLLGFDLKKSGEETHWHNEHQRETNVSMWQSHMIPGFKTAADILNKKQIEIFNTNFDSAILDFPFEQLSKLV